jgi:isopentenyldiphosphate isomerase
MRIKGNLNLLNPTAITGTTIFVSMSEEIFDVVNDRNEIIGQQPRSVVHRDGLKHRAVHVLVFNSRGDLYLQKRSMLKDCFPGTWDSSASGHLDCGEEYDACAVREVREELGYELGAVPNRLFEISARPETGQEFVWVYRCELEGPFSLQWAEVEAGGWFAPEVVSHWTQHRPEDFAPAFVLIWSRVSKLF